MGMMIIRHKVRDYGLCAMSGHPAGSGKPRRSYDRGAKAAATEAAITSMICSGESGRSRAACTKSTPRTQLQPAGVEIGQKSK